MAHTGNNSRRSGGDGIPMKLLIDGKTNKVLFAEAGKEMVDFLFTLLSLPLATVVTLLGKRSVPSAVVNLFDSVQRLDNSVIVSTAGISPEQMKADLLNPTVHLKVSGGILQLPSIVGITSETYYSCSSGYTHCDYEYVKKDCNNVCPSCRRKMTRKLQFLPPVGGKSKNIAQVVEGEGGFVTGLITYTITDSLNVTPLSTISALSLMKKHNVLDLSALEEKIVTVGIDEGNEILKASLNSSTVLTDVFVGKETQVAAKPAAE